MGHVHPGAAAHAQVRQQIKAKAEALGKIIASFQARIKALLDDPRSWAADKVSAAAVLDELDRILKGGKKLEREWLEKNLTWAIDKGAAMAGRDILAAGKTLAVTQVNQATLKRSIKDAYTDVAGRTEEVGERVTFAIRDAAARTIRRAVARGVHPSTTSADMLTALEKGGFSGPVIFRAVSDRLKDLSPEDRNAALRKLVDEGQLTAFVDAGGRMWDPESYAKMLAVTVQSRVYAEGNMDRQLANGIRMGVITGSGLKADALCGPWRRMIVAYDAETAREYRLAQLSELPSGGPPFHPWCQDQCLAIDPATVSKAALEESSARRDRYESLLGIGHGKAYREAAAALGL